MPSKMCAACGVSFAGRRERKACSLQCGNVLKLRPKAPRPCELCENAFVPTLPQQRYCSMACSSPARHIGRPGRSSAVRFPDCIVCSRVFCTSNGKAKVCSDECRRRSQSDWAVRKYATDPSFRDRNLAAVHARRTSKLGMSSPAILLSYLIERDGGRCRLPHCLMPTRKVDPIGARTPAKPSIDHVIPLSLGGEHELHNVQLAHYRCNLSKNNRASGDQLALIG